MRIVVLNECFLSEEHLDKLRKFGEVELFTDTTTEKQVIDRLKDADIAIADCFVAPLNEKVFNQLEDVKYISLNSTGYDLADITSANKNGVQLSNIPGYSTEAVAEHTIGLMFAVARHLVQMNDRVHTNPYEIDPSDKSQLPLLGFDLRGKTLGIVGLGSIGKRVSEMANGIGMKVIGFNRSPKTVNNVESVTLEELLKRSDVVSLHVPLNDQSSNMIGEKELALMKPGAIIINTARGKLINAEALSSAINSKKLSGAGIDTLARWDKQNPLMTTENVIITPHGAWYTKESFESLANMLIENVEAYINGEPKNLITK